MVVTYIDLGPNCESCCCNCTVTVAAPQGCALLSVTDAEADFQVSPADCDDKTSLPGETGGQLRYPMDLSGSGGSSGVISIAAPDWIECSGGAKKYFSHWLIDVNCCIQNFDDFRDDGGSPPGVYCHYDPVLTIRLCDRDGVVAAGGCACTVTPVYGAAIDEWECGCCSCYLEGVHGSSCGCQIDEADQGAGSPCYDPDEVECLAGAGSYKLHAIAEFVDGNGANPNLTALIQAVGSYGLELEYGGRSQCGDDPAGIGEDVCAFGGEDGEASTCTPTPTPSCSLGSIFPAKVIQAGGGICDEEENGVYCQEPVTRATVGFSEIGGGLDINRCPFTSPHDSAPSQLTAGFAFSPPSPPTGPWGSHAARCYARRNALAGVYGPTEFSGPPGCLAGSTVDATYSAKLTIA